MKALLLTTEERPDHTRLTKECLKRMAQSYSGLIYEEETHERGALYYIGNKDHDKELPKVIIENIRCTCKRGTLFQRFRNLFGRGSRIGHIEVMLDRKGQFIACNNCGQKVIKVE